MARDARSMVSRAIERKQWQQSPLYEHVHNVGLLRAATVNVACDVHAFVCVLPRFSDRKHCTDCGRSEIDI